MECYSAIEKNKILPFATAWMDLKGKMLRENFVRERQMPYDFTSMRTLKNSINEQTKQKQTPRFKDQTKLMVARGKGI